MFRSKSILTLPSVFLFLVLGGCSTAKQEEFVSELLSQCNITSEEVTADDCKRCIRTVPTSQTVDVKHFNQTRSTEEICECLNNTIANKTESEVFSPKPETKAASETQSETQKNNNSTTTTPTIQPITSKQSTSTTTTERTAKPQPITSKQSTSTTTTERTAKPQPITSKQSTSTTTTKPESTARTGAPIDAKCKKELNDAHQKIEQLESAASSNTQSRALAIAAITMVAITLVLSLIAIMYVLYILRCKSASYDVRERSRPAA